MKELKFFSMFYLMVLAFAQFIDLITYETQVKASIVTDQIVSQLSWFSISCLLSMFASLIIRVDCKNTFKETNLSDTDNDGYCALNFLSWVLVWVGLAALILCCFTYFIGGVDYFKPMLVVIFFGHALETILTSTSKMNTWLFYSKYKKE